MENDAFNRDVIRKFSLEIVLGSYGENMTN